MRRNRLSSPLRISRICWRELAINAACSELLEISAMRSEGDGNAVLLDILRSVTCVMDKDLVSLH